MSQERKESYQLLINCVEQLLKSESNLRTAERKKDTFFVDVWKKSVQEWENSIKRTICIINSENLGDDFIGTMNEELQKAEKNGNNKAKNAAD